MLRGRKKLILTLGDPNGIGPEIILKIFKQKKLLKDFELKIAGSKKILDEYSALLNLPEINSQYVIDIPVSSSYRLSPGNIDRHAGKISGKSVKLAAVMCMRKSFDAMITMPISKESLNLGGYNYHGHTEMLEEITNSDEVVMMLYSTRFSVALITGHIPIKKVGSIINAELLFRKIAVVNNTLVRNFKIRKPKIAVLALNPHSGDGGLIGMEEQNIILPLIEKMNLHGFTIRGPFSPDAYFAVKAYKKFDITVAMYHDQALIPFKMISFGKGVNYTAGLKIIRTSPDHGTAFDIAGTGKADIGSSIEAIKLAGKLKAY
ncbi:MAG: D-threonate 4-phosphate dehydrogenase [Ignavibacteria bacterium]|nr:D-threonate 4-phosphate dehydrogenase [Ignavibacteria bacterium]